MNLTSDGSFQVGDRTAFTVGAVPGLDPRTLQGQVVTLDGTRVRVLTVETVAIVDATGTAFSVIVEPA